MHEEISNFLYGEELIPVVFLIDCPQLGFIVNPEQGNSDIPATYSANLPFWLAHVLMEANIVKIEQPKWLKELGPGATIKTERSYDFSADIGIYSGDKKVPQKLIELAKERISIVLNSGLKTGNRFFDKELENVYFIEEKNIINDTQISIDQFSNWKSSGIRF